MTRQELDDYIDENITEKDALGVPASLTSEDEGNALKAVADYVDQETSANSLGYKRIVFDLDISSLTPTYLHDDFPTETKTFSNPSNGVIRVVGDANSTWSVANKTRLTNFVFDNSGQTYFGLGNDNLVGSPLYRLDINLKKFDNTQTGTPSTVLKNVEIRVYP